MHHDAHRDHPDQHRERLAPGDHPRSGSTDPSRRTLLLAGLTGITGLALLGCTAPTPGPGPTAAGGTPTTDPPGSPAAVDVPATQAALAALETETGVHLSVAVLDTATGTTFGHRADERVLLCSTAKVLVVAAVLAERAGRPGILGELVPYDQSQVVDGSPVTGEQAGTGMSVAALCDAALTSSDNTAANLLMSLVGGPAGVTAYVRTLGDDVTRLDRLEPALNEGAPGDERDTSTPARMVADLERLVLGDALPAESRDPLTGWLRGATTGAARIRAGVPAGWTVGDKTGTGPGGEVHDVAVVWPPDRDPVVLAVYTTPAAGTSPSTAAGEAAIARATAIVVGALVPGALVPGAQPGT
jgi:beta-lactamase class A